MDERQAIKLANMRAPSDRTLSILLPMLILLSSFLFLLLIFLIFLILARRRRGIRLDGDDDGPLDLGREEEEGEAAMDGMESRWLQAQEEPVKAGYARAKAWQVQYPPNSQPTDITLSQFLSIQEKGVSAWSFEPDYESNPPLLVQSRTEIIFLPDGLDMLPEQGGGASVQSNLPLPKLNEVYYWEAKLYEKPITTNIAIGLATKPYPSFRLPGWNKFSVGYFSQDGYKAHNYPFTASPYGPPLLEGDVIGVGYRPRTGAVFFTRNGKKLDDAYVGLNRYNLFPTVGADGPASVHVNLGQAGFVFIEANVKKWGLAPTTGTLAPPPAYGSERGSILLEAAGQRAYGSERGSILLEAAGQREVQTPRRSSRRQSALAGSAPNVSSPLRSNRRRRSSGSSGSIHEAPIEAPLETPLPNRTLSEDEDDLPHNPPTPNLLDISLHALNPFNPFARRRSRQSPSEENDEEDRPTNYDRPPPTPREEGSRRIMDPPAYHMVDPNTYAPGVAEAMLGEQYAQFASGQPSSFPGQSTYEGRVSASSPDSPQTGTGLANVWRNLWRPRPELEREED